MTNTTTCEEIIHRSKQDTWGKAFRENQWGKRHCEAWALPRGFEYGIVTIVEGAAKMADRHYQAYRSPIGDDGFLGPAWTEILQGVRTMLNGETGRLDCGTVDALLLAMAASQNADLDA